MKTKSHHSAIEPLEARIAPAATFVNPTTANFTDVDGDLVTVKFSKSFLPEANISSVLIMAPAGLLGGQQLQSINLQSFLNSREAEGTNITVTAKRQDVNGDGFLDGDGLVNVGEIQAGAPSMSPATGLDLGAIKIRGDLGRISAGSNDITALSVKSLSVLSLGRFGTTTGAADLGTAVLGKFGALAVTGDLGSAAMEANVYAQDFGTIKVGGSVRADILSARAVTSVKIGGDLTADIEAYTADTKVASIKIGGSFSGGIIRAFSLGTLHIGGDVRGSSSDTGRVLVSRALGSVFVGGDVIGSGTNSGNISAASLGAVKIAGDLRGGSGAQSGTITGQDGLGSLTIGGSIIGGTGDSSGMVRADDGTLGRLTIGGSLRGGSMASFGDPTPTYSGYIQAVRLGTITISGSILSGSGVTATGGDPHNASIRAQLDLGSLTVKGSIVGDSFDIDNRVVISAASKYFSGTVATSDLTIGKITVGGSLERADILAGYRPDRTAQNPDAQIGSVMIGGDWVASHLIAGVADGGNGFGDGNDAKISGALISDNDDATGAISKIARVVIKGSAIGTLSSTDGAVFGIEAQHIVSIKVGGAKEPVQAGRSNDIFNLRNPLGATFASDGTGDMRAFEVL